MKSNIIRRYRRKLRRVQLNFRRMNFTLIGDEGKPWRRAIAIAAGVLLLLVALIFGRAETQLMSSAEVKTVQERGVLRIGVIPDMPGAELEKELGLNIQSYEDLLNPALKGRIVLSDPNSSSAAWNNMCNIFAVYGYDTQEAWDYLRALLENGLVISTSSSVCFKSVDSGEYVVGLTYEDGADTLRHLYVLLTGLGMRESSGRYCEGRDMDADNTAANTAEAGLFQSSYNLIGKSALMQQLFASYAGSTELLSVFQEGVHCKPGDLENHGSEKNGLAFQQLSKSCPAFAVELAALGLRLRRRLWGPINGKTAELRFECDWMLLQVQHAVKQSMQ